MSELRFAFDEMRRELDDFYKFAKRFLDPSADECLKHFSIALENIKSSAPLADSKPPVVNRQYLWAIPEYQPLLTIPSRDYEKGKRRGGREIVGRLTAVWEIIPDPKKSKWDKPKQFRLSGKASVAVEWLDASTKEPLLKWNVDVADQAAPGCMFHVQFSTVIPVPRMPCLAFTPLAVAEHVLGELFQDQWEKHSRDYTVHMDNWATLQKRRLTALLAWHQKVIDGCTGAPWTALKTERLPQDSFVKNK